MPTVYLRKDLYDAIIKAKQAENIEQAQKELKNIETSLNRVINQVRSSCIELEIKKRMVDELTEMAFEVHHLTPVERPSV